MERMHAAKLKEHMLLATAGVLGFVAGSGVGFGLGAQANSATPAEVEVANAYEAQARAAYVAVAPPEATCERGALQRILDDTATKGDQVARDAAATTEALKHDCPSGDKLLRQLVGYGAVPLFATVSEARTKAAEKLDASVYTQKEQQTYIWPCGVGVSIACAGAMYMRNRRARRLPDPEKLDMERVMQDISAYLRQHDD